MITDLGSLTLGAILPATAGATIAIDAAVGVELPTIEAQVDAVATFEPSIDMSLAAQLSIATSVVANIEAAIAVVPPITPPTLEAQAEIAAEVSATLNARLAILLSQSQIAIDINALLANGSVRLLKYSGPQDDFGAELTAELGAPTTNVNALVLLTSNGASWTAMQALFKTTA